MIQDALYYVVLEQLNDLEGTYYVWYATNNDPHVFARLCSYDADGRETIEWELADAVMSTVPSSVQSVDLSSILQTLQMELKRVQTIQNPGDQMMNLQVILLSAYQQLLQQKDVDLPKKLTKAFNRLEDAVLVRAQELYG